MPYQPIENYGVIGDLRTAALIGKNGSLDWLCLPHFDSPACFAALLGTPEHGRWLLAPRDGVPVGRRYRDGTLVLGGGVASAGELLIDPIRAEVARRVHVTDLGAVEIVPAELGTAAGAIGAALHGAAVRAAVPA